MKKIISLIISIFLFININACTGYVPIYSSSNFNFKIEDYSLKGEERLTNLIFRKLNNVSLSSKDNLSARSISISIETKKEKKPTVKNTTGKVLEYEINLITNVIINDFLTNNKILSHNFDYSISYKVQDEYSETIKLENQNIDNLVNKTYEDILIKISEKIATQ